MRTSPSALPLNQPLRTFPPALPHSSRDQLSRTCVQAAARAAQQVRSAAMIALDCQHLSQRDHGCERRRVARALLRRMELPNAAPKRARALHAMQRVP